MKMNDCTVLCLLLLINVSMSASIEKENGKDLNRQRRLCTPLSCSYVECDKSIRHPINQADECKKLGCKFTHFRDVNQYRCAKYKAKGCFPGSAMVTTRTGNVAMETLNVGDSVLTVVDNKEMHFTKVVGFAQRQPGKKAHFLSITAANQAGHTHTLRLTATHNIYVKSKIADDQDEYITRFAEDVFVGDVLKTQTDNGTALNDAIVTHVTLHKEMGVYAPLTEAGTMLVDGTLVSCYASFNDNLIHVLMAPIRWFPWLFADAEKPLDGALPYVETLKYIGRNYIAPIVSLN